MEEPDNAEHEMTFNDRRGEPRHRPFEKYREFLIAHSTLA